MDRTKLIEEYEPPVKEFFEQVASPKQEAKHSEALREWLKHQPKDQKIAWVTVGSQLSLTVTSLVWRNSGTLREEHGALYRYNDLLFLLTL